MGPCGSRGFLFSVNAAAQITRTKVFLQINKRRRYLLPYEEEHLASHVSGTRPPVIQYNCKIFILKNLLRRQAEHRFARKRVNFKVRGITFLNRLMDTDSRSYVKRFIARRLGIFSKLNKGKSRKVKRDLTNRFTDRYLKKLLLKNVRKKYGYSGFRRVTQKKQTTMDRKSRLIGYAGGKVKYFKYGLRGFIKKKQI
jgi:hypothetical protein